MITSDAFERARKRVLLRCWWEQEVVDCFQRSLEIFLKIENINTLELSIFVLGIYPRGGKKAAPVCKDIFWKWLTTTLLMLGKKIKRRHQKRNG